MYNYGNHLIAAPHPPTAPVTPRTARGNGTPRTPCPKTRGQYPVTTAGQSKGHRGGGKKRSPSTPVEDEDGEVLFERHERDGSAGSKRMRSDDEVGVD